MIKVEFCGDTICLYYFVVNYRAVTEVERGHPSAYAFSEFVGALQVGLSNIARCTKEKH